MSDETPKVNANPEESMRLARDVFTPALQHACKTAREQGGQEIDIINAILNSHASLMIQLLGHGPAAGLMKAHVEHVERALEKQDAASPQ
ncbi:MAG: hypothetical protein AAF495_21660 [Pseudomonadota bacterium]